MPPRSKKTQSKRERPSEDASFAEKESEVHQRLADIELEVEKRCQEIQLASQVFVESLKAAFSAHLMKFPKATRSMTTEEFFGEEVQQFSDVRSKAEFILMSACKPGRPPLTAARPTQPPAASTQSTQAQPAIASVPGSALRGARSQRAFETPRHVGKTGVTFSTPAGSSAAMETPGGLVSSVYVSKIKSLEEELRALKEKYEGRA